MFHYVSLSLETYVPSDHPLRRIRELADTALRGMRRQLTSLYSTTGRPSIPPEQLLRALLLQSLYTIRSERQLVEQIRYNMLFRWFVGLDMEDEVWDFSTFSHNRDRFLTKDVAALFREELLLIAESHDLLSKDHFTVDGTLIDAAASMKSFVPKSPETTSNSDGSDKVTSNKDGSNKDGSNKDGSNKDGSSPQNTLSIEPLSDSDADVGRPDPGNPDVNFHGERRSNATHRSTTDPEARLYKKGKGKEARLSFMGHVLMENRHGLIVDCCVTLATGTAERDAAETMVARLKRRKRRSSGRITLGADKGYDTRNFIGALRKQKVTPHIAGKNTTILDGRTTRHAGYKISQKKRKRVEEIFGWTKTCAGMAKARFRGSPRVGLAFALGGCTYNLIRISNILASG